MFPVVPSYALVSSLSLQRIYGGNRSVEAIKRSYFANPTFFLGTLYIFHKFMNKFIVLLKYVNPFRQVSF